MYKPGRDTVQERGKIQDIIRLILLVCEKGFSIWKLALKEEIILSTCGTDIRLLQQMCIACTTWRTFMCFSFLFVWPGIEKITKICWNIWFPKRISSHSVEIFWSLSCYMWCKVIKKLTRLIIVFSNTDLCKEETTMVVVRMMTYKNSLIWCHMFTLCCVTYVLVC